MPTIQELLEKKRNELLDLSTRNRLARQPKGAVVLLPKSVPRFDVIMEQLSIPVNSKSARIIQDHGE